MALQALDLNRTEAAGPAAGSAVAEPSFGAVPVARLLKVALLLIVVGQLGRVPLTTTGTKEAPLLLNDLLVVGLVVAGLAVALRRRDLRLDPASLFALLFVGVGGLSTLIAVPRFRLTFFEATVSLAYLGRWAACFGIYLVVLNAVRRSEVEGIWRALEVAILIFASFGVFQSLILPDFAFLVFPDADRFLDWDPQGRRLVSTFLDPNFAGFFVVLGLLLYGGRLAFGRSVAAWKVVLLATALVLTLSRSSVLALAAGAAVIVAVRGSSRRFLKAAGGLAAAVLVSSPVWLPFAAGFNKLAIDDASGLARLVQWLWALTIFADNPVVGVGFNTYGFVSSRYEGIGVEGASSFGLDGGILFVAVMTGVVGSVLFVVLLGLLFRSALRTWRRRDLDPGLRGIALGAGAAVPALVAHSLFVNTLLYAPLLFPLWALWGCTAVLGGEDPGHSGPPEPQVEFSGDG